MRWIRIEVHMSKLRHKDHGLEVAPLRTVGLWPSWRWFDEMFWDADGNKLIKVEEFTEHHTLVVRAELPGIDPEKDVEVRVEGGVLHIGASREASEEKTDRKFYRKEFRYGSFVRSLPLPEGVDGTSVSATYTDGILEVRVPTPAPDNNDEAHRVPVARM
jgi:HSP20 family protein